MTDPIIYRPSKGSQRATLHRGERSVVLTKTAELLFAMLIERPGCYVSRMEAAETLFAGMTKSGRESSISDLKTHLHDVIGAVDLAIMMTEGAGYRLIDRPTTPTVEVREE